MRERLLKLLLGKCEQQMLYYSNAIALAVELEEMESSQIVYDYWYRLYVRIANELARSNFVVPRRTPVVEALMPHVQVQRVRYGNN